MKANELRVGNWVNDESGAIPYQIRPQDFLPLALAQNEGKAKPITLTSEILHKAGFKQNGQFFNIRYLDYTFWTNRFSYKGKAIDNDIKYLHQLQNLYFAITGKELNIEL